MQQQVFPQYETKVIEPVGDRSCFEGVNGVRKSVVMKGRSDSSTWNLHTTIKLLCPNETVRVSISPVLLKTKYCTYSVENDVSLQRMKENSVCSRLYYQCKRMDRDPQFTSGVSP